MLPCCIYKTLRAETIFQDELSEDVGCGELFFCCSVNLCQSGRPGEMELGDGPEKKRGGRE